MRKKILTLGICCTMLLSGCSLSPDDVSNAVNSGIEAAKEQAGAESSQEPQESEAPEAKEMSLGEKATIGDWKVTVKKANVKSKIKNGKYYVFKPDKGQKFVCVTMNVKNTGKEEASFLPRVGYSNTMVTAKLYYEDYEYKATDLLSYDKDLLEKSIKPLQGKTGIVAFEVPKKAAKNKGKLTLRIGTDEDSVVYKLKK